MFVENHGDFFTHSVAAHYSLDHLDRFLPLKHPVQRVRHSVPHPSLDANDLGEDLIEGPFGLETTERILNFCCSFLLLQLEDCSMVQQVELLAVELQHLLSSDTSTEGLVDIPLLAFTELVHEPNDAALSCCLALPFDHIGNFL